MARFMFLQRGDCSDRPEMTPDQMEAQMKSCMEWVRNGTDEGWLLDPGCPLKSGGAVVQPDLTVIDGPFAESKELVGGYTIVEAPDLETACQFAKRTIEMAGAGRIEVREMVNVGG